MKVSNLILFALFFITSIVRHAYSIDQIISSEYEKSLVVIIPSYNNRSYYKQNLDSVFKQKYSNFHVIYIDDCSTDGTCDLVKKYIDDQKQSNKIELIHNETRSGAMANLYNAIYSCKDYEIIVTLDGDDWFAHDKVLSKINEIYADPHVWITFGQFVFWPSGQIGYCHDIPRDSIEKKCIRQYCGLATHLRTFYVGLFKLIKKEDLLREGEFYPVTWDKAMMAPMLEMANGRWKFIDEVLYVYNFANPLNDGRTRGDLANQIAAEIFAKEAYQPLEKVLPFDALNFEININ
jgi:glycosyltransferase involved in cell wall biosynthesis